MIQPKRVLHRILWLAITPLTVGVFLAALAARQPIPASPGLAPLLGEDLPGEGMPAVPFTWLDGALRGEWISGERPEAFGWVRLTPLRPLRLANVLVYLTDAGIEEGFLLGSFSGEWAQSFRLPAGRSQGTLLLYSLAKQEELDRTSVPAAEGGAQ